MGLAEAIYHSLNQFKDSQGTNLCQNIFLTGGTSLFPHFVDRIENEVRMIRPTQSPLRIWSAADPLLDAWKGASKWQVRKISIILLQQKQLRRKGTTLLQSIFCILTVALVPLFLLISSKYQKHAYRLRSL